MGLTQFGIPLQTASDPEDKTASGRADIDRFADFMRGLKPQQPIGVAVIPNVLIACPPWACGPRRSMLSTAKISIGGAPSPLLRTRISRILRPRSRNIREHRLRFLPRLLYRH